MKNLIALVTFFTFGLLYTQNDHFNLKKGIGIQGYDPVSYFEGLPQKGNKTISADHKGATYYFSSEDNKEKFLRNPSAFEPQYGGWCAYAMGVNGEKVKINPETFKIIDGKLYLFYNAFFNNTLEAWNEDEDAYKKKADENWTKLIKS